MSIVGEETVVTLGPSRLYESCSTKGWKTYVDQVSTLSLRMLRVFVGTEVVEKDTGLRVLSSRPYIPHHHFLHTPYVNILGFSTLLLVRCPT